MLTESLKRVGPYLAMISIVAGVGGSDWFIETPVLTKITLVGIGIAVISSYVKKFTEKKVYEPIDRIEKDVGSIKENCKNRKIEVNEHIKEFRGWSRGILGYGLPHLKEKKNEKINKKSSN